MLCQSSEARIFKNLRDLYEVINYTLVALTQQTSALRQTKTIFNSSRALTVSLPLYLSRIFGFMHCSGSCYIIALILLDRLKTANPIYTLTPRNIHKLVFTAILIASKTVDDLSFSQEYYAKVAGLKSKQLSQLQLKFLLTIGFNTHVDSERFYQYAEKLEKIHEENKLLSPKQAIQDETKTNSSLSHSDSNESQKSQEFDNSFSSSEN